ncbi:MAG: response regulator transcription factor [Bacteroidota bacterium]
MIKIIIVDDHQIFVEALRVMLDDDPDIEVVGTANSPHDGLALVAKHSVDVAVLDLRLQDPEMDGLDLAEKLYDEYPRTRVLLLTMSDDGKQIARALTQEVAGFMGKNSAGAGLKKAIRQIHQGDTFYSVDVMKAHMDYIRKQHMGGGPINLTRREKEILQLLVEEYSTSEIGELLNIGDAGVETHRRNLRHKLGVRNTAGLVREAVVRNLVTIKK